MKIQIIRPSVVEAKFLTVYCGGRTDSRDLYFTDSNNQPLTFEGHDQLFERFPELKVNHHGEDQILLVINIDEGRILNWPQGYRWDAHNLKIVDEGTYILSDENAEVIKEHTGYVPDILAIDDAGYGDYFEFEVDASGYIKFWRCDQELLDEILEQGRYE